jgi:hypothetical protein
MKTGTEYHNEKKGFLIYMRDEKESASGSRELPVTGVPR